jgi:hypothetical protein
MFGRQDSDTREDFIGAFDFEDAFIRPFQPKNVKQRAMAS